MPACPDGDGLGDNQFFAEDGRYLMCQTHNAYYEPASGECIAGPPTACGKFFIVC